MGITQMCTMHDVYSCVLCAYMNSIPYALYWRRLAVWRPTRQPRSAEPQANMHTEIFKITKSTLRDSVGN